MDGPEEPAESPWLGVDEVPAMFLVRTMLVVGTAASEKRTPCE